jgi:hypothetical protein
VVGWLCQPHGSVAQRHSFVTTKAGRGERRALQLHGRELREDDLWVFGLPLDEVGVLPEVVFGACCEPAFPTPFCALTNRNPASCTLFACCRAAARNGREVGTRTAATYQVVLNGGEPPWYNPAMPPPVLKGGLAEPVSGGMKLCVGAAPSPTGSACSKGSMTGVSLAVAVACATAASVCSTTITVATVAPRRRWRCAIGCTSTGHEQAPLTKGMAVFFEVLSSWRHPRQDDTPTQSPRSLCGWCFESLALLLFLQPTSR